MPLTRAQALQRLNAKLELIEKQGERTAKAIEWHRKQIEKRDREMDVLRAAHYSITMEIELYDDVHDA